MSRRLLGESEAYELLHENGVPVPQNGIARDAENAMKIAEGIGFPVVMKVVSQKVIHKSDSGGVVIGIKSKDEAAEAFRKIVSNVSKVVSREDIEGVIVEKHMPPGLELIIGGKVDSSFGKVLTFGLGGTLVEMMKDVTLGILPLNDEDIRRMIHRIKGYQLIAGYRGESPKDEEALAEIIGKISGLFAAKSSMVEFDINPLILYGKGACAVDSRIYWDEDAPQNSEEKIAIVNPEIFYPKTIAVVGASANPKKIGYSIMRNLLNFKGELYGVNPHEDEILGKKAYQSLGSIPGNVDTVVLAVPGTLVPQVMEEAGNKGVKLAVVISAGFKEIGGAGVDLESRTLEIARKHGIRMIGPNCLGMIMPGKGLNATFDPASPKPGQIAFISQSGATVTTVVDWSLEEKQGFSVVISVGNQADLGFVDFLRFVEQDKETKAVILYIEEIKNGAEFLLTANDVAAKKPVIAIKSASSKKGQKAAASHTGSLAGSYEVYRAGFDQAGVIPSDSLREAFQIGELLASEGYPRGNRAIIMTNAGGFAVLATDYAEKYGIDVVELPGELLGKLNSFLTEEWSHENPMDLVGDAPSDRFAKVFDVMIDNQDLWDIAVIVVVPTTVLDPDS